MKLFARALAITAAVAAVHAADSKFTCMPGEECWPSLEEWDAFNETIGGALKVTRPWAEPCYANPASEACLEVAEQYVNSTGAVRTSFYGQATNLNWEVCGRDSCLLNSLAPTEGVSGTCKLGRLSAYHVNATSAEQVAATLQFVRAHHLRLSIKNTGHDYFGRSGAANSLALWTRNLRDMEYRAAFTPQGAADSEELRDIGVIGAGVNAGEAVNFFAQHGMHVTVGAVSSVGIAGGFGQGGGHGPLAPSYGLMVDQAVEFDVVTADGELRTVNAHQDPDLFWAMRGGGGGSYAVLVSYKFQLHPAVPMNVFAFVANLTEDTLVDDLTESRVHRDVVAALARNQTNFSNHQVAGYNFFLPYNIISLQVLPSADTEALKALTKDYAEFLASVPGLHILTNEYKTLDTYPEYAAYMLPYLELNGPLGVGIAEASRLIPRTLFEEPESIDDLVSAFLRGLQTSQEQGAGLGSGSGQIYATGPANTYDEEGATAAHPAWRGSLWYVIHGGIWLSTDSDEERAQIHETVGQAIQGFKDLTPGGGTYVNEGDYLEPEWQQTFFGSHYDRLLEVKQKYDPEGLFNCWKCVGFTGEADPLYSCYGLGDGEEIPTQPLDDSQNGVMA